MQQKESVKKVFIGGEFSTLKPLEAYIKISNFNIVKVAFRYLDIPDKNIIKKSKPIVFENIFEDEEELEEELVMEETKNKDENKAAIRVEETENQAEVATESINELAILQMTKGEQHER
jgi:hypothetical protein